MEQKKVINPLLSKNVNGISLAESVTKITGVNAESNGNAAASVRKSPTGMPLVGRSSPKDWRTILV